MAAALCSLAALTRTPGWPRAAAVEVEDVVLVVEEPHGLAALAGMLS